MRERREQGVRLMEQWIAHPCMWLRRTALLHQVHCYIKCMDCEQSLCTAISILLTCCLPPWLSLYFPTIAPHAHTHTHTHTQLSYKTDTDRTRLFKFCLAVADEDEFFIRKAIGWSLREYSRTDKTAVREFVEKNREKLSNLSAREALKHC